MKKIILLLSLLVSILSADLKREPISMQVIGKVPIVDIRTIAEWHETGLIKSSIPIQFFDEKGRYDIEGFLKELNAKVDTKKQFGIICNSGSRTKILAKFLSDRMHYNVIDFQGGILYAQGKKIPFVKYGK